MLVMSWACSRWLGSKVAANLRFGADHEHLGLPTGELNSFRRCRDPAARAWLRLGAERGQSQLRTADQPDVIAGSVWPGYDHQSAAWLVTLPGVLNIRERNPFRVDIKFSFCRMRHDLLKSFEQDVPRRNPSSAQNR